MIHVAANLLLENIALRKSAVQSGGNSLANLAVDGSFHSHLCSTTANMTDPWWSVDLLRQTIVTHVYVTTCGTLADFIIGLTDTPVNASHPPSHYTLCANYSRELPVGTSILTCQPTSVSGRFLFIRRIRAPAAVLTLSEVQVYSVLSPLPGGRLTWYSDISTDPSLLGPDSCSEFHPGHVFSSDLGERKHIAAVHMRVNPDGNCADIQHGGADTDGVYTIYPSDQPLQVYCDLTTDGGGWTVFQRRIDGSVDFYRDWNDYKNGFGSTNGEFWLGNDNIHSLTTSGKQVLRIDLETFDGETRFAEYSGFSVDDGRNYYTLRFDAYLQVSSTAVPKTRITMNMQILLIPVQMRFKRLGALCNITVAATDDDPRQKTPRDLPETSYRVCSVVPSKCTGLARCNLTDVYGRYVFIKATPETKCKLCEVEVYLFPVPNMALNKMTFSKMTAQYSTPGFAVDGNVSTFAFLDCVDAYPWWAVDLCGHYQVAEVFLVMKKLNNLTNYDVGVTSTPPADKPPTTLAGDEYHSCGVIDNTLPEYTTICFPCQSAGRYVFVMLMTTSNTGAAIHELEVYVQLPISLVNIACNMAADQSSSTPEGGAMLAVDGNTSAIWWHKTCSYTDREQNPWWRVDLAYVYNVWHVVVTHFEQHLLRDFAIWMSIDYTAVPPGDGSICARYSSPPWQVGVSHVTCVQPPVPARYVSLIAHGSNTVLVLCEVQVFGSLNNALDDTYIRMLQKAQNVSWRHHVTNQNLYASLKRITTIVIQLSLRLAGHVMRHDEAAKKVLLWKPDGPRRGVTCPPIKKSEAEKYNDTCTSYKKFYNDTCEMSCELGYNLTSSDGVHKCTENGTWSNNVTCEHVTCHALPPDPHGKYSNATCTAQKTFYKESCQLECDLGYVVNGNPVQTCRLNGNWSSDIHCIGGPGRGDPGRGGPGRGGLDEATRDEAARDEATRDEATRDEAARDDVFRARAQLKRHNSIDKDKAIFLNEDLTAKQVSLAYKTNRLCPEVNDTVHARLVSGNDPFVPNTVLQYVCNEGYELTDGHLELSCQKDGMWSWKAPNCTGIKCPVSVFPNNTEVESGDLSAHVYNSTITYRCAEGHDLMFGDLSRTCQSSKTWSGQAPTCKVVYCGPPAPVANAHATMTGEAYLANITYECKPGFRPEPDGDWTRQCQADKRWSGTAPLCRPCVAVRDIDVETLCEAPTAVANTSLTTDGVRVNDTATYTCLAGHRLRAGNLTKVCNDSGQWQNDDPQCIEVHCGPPLKVVYANYWMSGGDTVGGKVMYTCIHGYERRSGSGFSSCPLNGEWTTPTLVCEEVTCGMPEPVKHAVMTTSYVRRDCVADYRCDVGYVGDTRKSRCTVDGQWTPVSLNCSRVRCGETGEGEGTIVTDQTGDSYEATVTIECRYGHHRVTGSHMRTCLGGGTWSGKTLVCAQTTCVTPANVIGALVSIGNVTVRAKVSYRAQNTYSHVGGDLVRTCREDGLWTGEQPVFQEITCPAIQSDEDSKVKFFTDGVVVGSHVTYSCVAGYRLSAGDATCACLVSGKWSCGPPTCTRE
ncbi:hypothetical protein LSAT2_018021 [Lamellibrachia satsuma]|nr:hypothetical protein LSAT2_018021 [Lamellibrachia satsuma]